MSCFHPCKFTTTPTPPLNISKNTATTANVLQAKDELMKGAYYRTENQAAGQQKHPILSSDTKEGFDLPCPPLDEVDSMICPTTFFDVTPSVLFMGIDDDDDDDYGAVAKRCEHDEATIIKKKGLELDEASIDKKLEATKRKLRGCYEEVARAKKRKQPKLLDLNSLPRCK